MEMFPIWPFILCIILSAQVVMVTRGDESIKERMYFDDKLGINCLKCPPGTYKVEDCTRDNYQAGCRPCNISFFQTDYNIATSCEECRSSCQIENREDFVENCSATTNNYCVCKPGHYRDKGENGLCLKHHACPAGQGVVKAGTPLEDTMCETCADGYFSPNSSLTQICQPCSKCEEGYIAKESCTAAKDTVCKPENENGSLMIIIGIVCGVVLLFLIISIVVIVQARRGRGPRLFQTCCTQRNSFDPENSPEKTPLSEIEKPASGQNGMTNGDLVDRPESQNGNFTEDPPGVVPDKTLVALSHDLISLEWPFFFRNLIGETADTLIDESIIDNKGVREQIYKLLRKWKHMRKDKATMEEILATLKETGKNDLVQKYSAHRSTDV